MIAVRNLIPAECQSCGLIDPSPRLTTANPSSYLMMRPAGGDRSRPDRSQPKVEKVDV